VSVHCHGMYHSLLEQVLEVHSGDVLRLGSTTRPDDVRYISFEDSYSFKEKMKIHSSVVCGGGCVQCSLGRLRIRNCNVTDIFGACGALGVRETRRNRPGTSLYPHERWVVSLQQGSPQGVSDQPMGRVRA
jgi:hypothetical protein